MNNIAVFIDLNRTNFDFEVFKDIFLNLQKYGKIIYGKLYNFSSSKHKDYLNIISKYEFETAPKKKTALSKGDEDVLDIRQVVDILDLAHSKTKIDTMFLITGSGNVVPVIKSLKMKNIFVIGAYDYSEKNNRDMCDENFDYNLSSKIEVKKEEVTQTQKIVKTKKESTKAPIKKAVTKTAEKKETKKPVAKKVEKTEKEPSKKEIAKKSPSKKTADKKETVKPAEKKVTKKTSSDKEQKTVSKPAPKTAVKKSEPKATDKKQEKPAKEKKAPAKKEQKPVEAKKTVVKKQEPAKKTVEKAPAKKEKNNGISEEEQYYINVLENFASRTSELNFEYNEDIDQKVALLKDIEQFVEEEKAIQYEKDEFNPEIMAVLRELGNLATDIRATIDDSHQDDDIYDY